MLWAGSGSAELTPGASRAQAHFSLHTARAGGGRPALRGQQTDGEPGARWVLGVGATGGQGWNV